MIVTIMQPAYLPWLGFFDRVLRSDLLITLDHVAFPVGNRDKFVNRNRIRTAQGWTWLTIPIRHVKGQRQAINQVEIASDRRWQVKHWRSIESCYRRAPFFDLVAPDLWSIYDSPWTRLVDVLEALTSVLFKQLGIAVPARSSALMNVVGVKSELVFNLCRAVGASRYISGPFGREYLDRTVFDKANIELSFHDYRHPFYTQKFPNFEPYMSVIDLVFNHGPSSLDILRGRNSVT